MSRIFWELMEGPEEREKCFQVLLAVDKNSFCITKQEGEAWI